MTDAHLPPLRTHLEAWEREAAAYWQTLIRAPHVLRRVGDQVNRSLETQQRVSAALKKAAPHGTLSRADSTRILYLLEDVESRLDALAMRIERLERKLP